MLEVGVVQVLLGYVSLLLNPADDTAFLSVAAEAKGIGELRLGAAFKVPANYSVC